MNRFNIRTLHDLSSDHTPLLVDLHAMPLKKSLRSRFLAPGTHVETFKDHLSELIDLNIEIQGTEGIDNAISSFMEKLIEAAAHAAPSTPRNAQAFVQPFLPSAIVDLVLLKRKVRREFARTGDFRIQQIYRRLSNRLHKVLTQRKQHQIDNLLENMGTDASLQFPLWRITKRFKFQASQKSAIRSPSGGWCRTSQDKAEVFASNLEERFKPLAFADANQCRLVAESLETPFQMAPPTDPVTLE